ncbi:MAG: aldo/keto reductase, partial [Erysipelotrichaceae bacterium]|nr:aldo/keto reductase [Erysipelotrichaceae bacterium]
MKMLKETYTLNNGVRIPKIGLGTWQMHDEKIRNAISAAFELGYRHIDTAEAYGNEKEVGEAVRASGLPREEIFVTTKVLAKVKDYEGARKCIEDSLAALDIGYIDLMIIHCPQPWDEYN